MVKRAGRRGWPWRKGRRSLPSPDSPLTLMAGPSAWTWPRPLAGGGRRASRRNMGTSASDPPRPWREGGSPTCPAASQAWHGSSAAIGPVAEEVDGGWQHVIQPLGLSLTKYLLAFNCSILDWISLIINQVSYITSFTETTENLGRLQPFARDHDPDKLFIDRYLSSI